MLFERHPEQNRNAAIWGNRIAKSLSTLNPSHMYSLHSVSEDMGIKTKEMQCQDRNVSLRELRLENLNRMNRDIFDTMILGDTVYASICSMPRLEKLKQAACHQDRNSLLRNFRSPNN